MGSTVAAYFDLDGTLLNASSEKTLTAHLARRRPWRIPGERWRGPSFVSNLLRGRAVYDAARNRGLSRWPRGTCSNAIRPTLQRNASKPAFHHRHGKSSLGTVNRATDSCRHATVAPMAEAMAEVLGMDAVYGCGPAERTVFSRALSELERSSSKERCPSCRRTRPTTGTISLSATVMATPSPIHGSWRCAAMPLPSVQKGPFVVMLRRKAGPSWTGVPEFM